MCLLCLKPDIPNDYDWLESTCWMFSIQPFSVYADKRQIFFSFPDSLPKLLWQGIHGVRAATPYALDSDRTMVRLY